jgi:hypothetical protein
MEPFMEGGQSQQLMPSVQLMLAQRRMLSTCSTGPEGRVGWMLADMMRPGAWGEHVGNQAGLQAAVQLPLANHRAPQQLQA